MEKSDLFIEAVPHLSLLASPGLRADARPWLGAERRWLVGIGMVVSVMVVSNWLTPINPNPTTDVSLGGSERASALASVCRRGDGGEHAFRSATIVI